MIIPQINNIKREQTFKGLALFNKKEPIMAYQNVSQNSGEYIKKVYHYLRSSCERPVEVNVETGRLMDIVNSEDSAIFIMNHTPKSIWDIYTAKFFNTLLYREYVYNNKTETCPRSKILTNAGFINNKSNEGDFLKWIGLIPVSLKRDKSKNVANARVILESADEVSKNKTNLFMFPEGNMMTYFFLPLKDKFQSGVSAIVKRVLDLKDSIKVIPLGFAHTNTESSIHIGEPVVFRRDGEKYIVNRGNCDSPNFDKGLADFYGGKDEIVITDNGEPVGHSGISAYISGILLKNLESCMKDAKSDLKHSKSKVYEL